ncbi:hypothetical protein C8R44DRAFT_989390 [Mycena epipterygia]|nr:hypothetical protein C8R44DRAFT_989390 [Mycena epipterygia]
MAMLTQNSRTTRLLEELIASTSSAGSFSSPSSNPFIVTPEQSNAGHSAVPGSIEAAFESIEAALTYQLPSTPLRNTTAANQGALAIWNLSPRSPYTPVRERATAPQDPPHLFRTRSATEFEPATPTPLPRSRRNLERLPSLEFGPASRSLERWFYTGIFEDAHEDGSEVGQEE